MKKIIIDIPATTTNLGPGFDCLGMAFNLHNTIEIEPGNYDGFPLTVEGEGANELKDPSTNLVLAGYQKVFTTLGKPFISARFKQINRIPFSRGLGSSAAAYLGGLAGANHLLGNPLSLQELIELGVQKEKHPDNIVPAAVGGFTVACLTEKGTFWIKLSNPQIPAVLAAIPEIPMKTSESRAILPDTIPFKDAVHNLGRAALIVASLSEGKWEFLSTAMEDKLHQPYRDTDNGIIAQCVKDTLAAGAYGTALSGSGSTILTFLPEGNQKVGQALTNVFQSRGIPVKLVSLTPVNEGIKIREE
jgi:homoserine kinase